MSDRTTRRNFIKQTSAATAGMAFANVLKPNRVLGANDRVRVALLGASDRAMGALVPAFHQHSGKLNFDFVAVCDIKEARRVTVKRIADTKYGNQSCSMYRDFRELLDRPDIDAVLIATGPNWHATAAMTAAKAGKDMYCEKPVTKNISQSLILAETMRRTGRVKP